MPENQRDLIGEMMDRSEDIMPLEASAEYWIRDIHEGIGTVADEILNGDPSCTFFEVLGSACMAAMGRTRIYDRFTGESGTVGLDRKIITRKVREERGKQKAKKGYGKDHDDMHSPLTWMAILTHEWSEMPLDVSSDESLQQYLTVLRKMAAVCVAAVEAIDRRGERGTVPPVDNLLWFFTQTQEVIREVEDPQKAISQISVLGGKIGMPINLEDNHD